MMVTDKNNMINGVRITPESYKGLVSLGVEINNELGHILRNWELGHSKKYVETMRNLWYEIQIIGYHCSDDLVRYAFGRC